MGGYSDIDFAVDGSGLWVMYSTDANSGRLVVSKLDPTTFGVTETWNTSSEPKRQMGNAFIVDGIVYCIDSYSQIHQTINYTYNTNTSIGTSTSIPGQMAVITWQVVLIILITNAISWNNGVFIHTTLPQR